jgi:hypothetical protein
MDEGTPGWQGTPADRAAARRQLIEAEVEWTRERHGNAAALAVERDLFERFEAVLARDQGEGETPNGGQ